MTSHIKRTMLGFKLANVYDGNTLGVVGTSSSGGGGTGDGAKGVYMFKLADPSGGGGSASSSSSSSSSSSPAADVAISSNDAIEEGRGSMAAPPQDQNQKRAMLLIESGVRFHPTT